MARLTGTGRLADDLYLMAHHDVTGKPLLQPRAIGLGLAGALLAELVRLGKIRLVPGGLAVADAAPPEDALADSVLGLMLGEPEQHPAQDLAAVPGPHRGGGRGPPAGAVGLPDLDPRGAWRGGRWVPVDADCAFAPLARVKSALDPSRTLNVHGAALAGLAAACGLGSRLSLYLPPKTDRRPRRGGAAARSRPA